MMTETDITAISTRVDNTPTGQVRSKMNELDESLAPLREQHADLSVRLERALADFDVAAVTELLPQVTALAWLLARGRENEAQLQAELTAAERAEQQSKDGLRRAMLAGNRERQSALYEARSLKLRVAQMKFNREAAGNASAMGITLWDEAHGGELARVETRLAALIREHSFTDWELDQPV